jgi:hypothetical protein
MWTTLARPNDIPSTSAVGQCLCLAERADQDKERETLAHRHAERGPALILSVEGRCGRSDGSLRAAGPSISEGAGAAAYRQGLRGQDGAAEQGIEIGEDGGQQAMGASYGARSVTGVAGVAAGWRKI